MKILVSNDDGVHAEGIITLAETLTDIAHVTVIAPDRNRSGASNSLTLSQPLRLWTLPNGFHYIDGTPTDCVHLAITGILEEMPDMVISGINSGSNLGDDILYSGTVAAAMEGRLLGYPAIAISLAGEQPQHFKTAAEMAKSIVRYLRQRPLPPQTILNINVPDLPMHQIAGKQITRLGTRHVAEPVIKSNDPRGRPIYWVAAAGKEQDAGPGTDFHAVRHGYISITPIRVDFTKTEQMADLNQWLDGFTL